MSLASIAIVVTGLLVFASISGRLQGSMITPPIIFIGFGFLIGAGGFNIAEVDPGHAAIHLVAEITLILVLFTDAARIDLDSVRRDHDLPVRMLLLGLPLTMLTGTVLGLVIFPEFTLLGAALLAALLAPTDAALGQAVVSARPVPLRIRQAINIESGLNDGIALPVVLLLAALAGGMQADTDAASWLEFGLMQITLGPLCGILGGYLGARLLDVAAERGWAEESALGIGILSLAILVYVVAELIGGNGFIAVFVGGMVFGNSIRHPCSFLFEFMETEGQLLMLITFLVFGAALLPEAIAHVTPSMMAYALLSLTVIRMLPVAISLIGSGVRLPTYLFLGWFGPRGLASILFVLLILENSTVPGREEILAITVITVGLSAVLHGVSAAPLARAYGRLCATMGQCEEIKPVADLPLRGGQTENQTERKDKT